MLRKRQKRITRFLVCFLLVVLVVSPVSIFAAPVSLQGGPIVDELNDDSLLFDRSPDIGRDTGSPEKFGNDSTRITNGTESEKYLIYKSADDDIKSIIIDAYLFKWAPDAAKVDLTAFVSADVQTYEPLALGKSVIDNPAASDWPLIRYDSYLIPSGTKFVKIILPARESGNAWATQVSKITLNDTTSAPASGLLDNLNDFNLIHEKSDNLGLDTANAQLMKGDASRLTRNTTDDGFFVYRTGFDIRTISADVFYWTGATAVDLAVSVSTDGVNYVPAAMEKSTSPGTAPDWPLTTFETTQLPISGARYVKFILSGKEQSWSTQVSRVVLNYNVAPVTASPGPMKITDPIDVTLSTPTDGAEIFYYTNHDAAVKPYSGPIQVANSTRITAFAKKTGMIDSSERSFLYTSAADETIDRYGQVKAANFPTKVTSDEQLKADAAEDEAYYNSLTPPSDRDPYGGLEGSQEQYGLTANGYFHTQTLANGRTVMVSPAGNAYFSLGVNGVGYAGDTFTQVSGREYTYEWLPPYESGAAYETAFLGKSADNFSFYAANRIKKLGKPFNNNEFYDESVQRLKKWGFNSEGAFSDSNRGAYNGFPNVRLLSVFNSLTQFQVPGIRMFDVFAPGVEAAMDAKFAAELPQYADDPTLIGYFVDNEFEFHRIKAVLPKKKASEVGSKRKLVDMVKEKYGDITSLNAAWETNYSSFDFMYENEIAIKTDAASKDMDAFLRVYFDTFYRMIHDQFRKYDHNHMLMGDRWLVGAMRDTNIADMVVEAAGKYMDVLSWNLYTFDLNMTTLDRLHAKAGGKPFLFSEFHYGEPSQGLTGGIRVVYDEAEKGKAYRNYVEKAAATGYVVGTHWFEYVDQAATGRWFQGYNGENFAIGLLNVADRPYKTFLSDVMETNYNIYDVMLGKKAPFSYDFGDRADRVSDKTFTLHETKTPIAIDGVLDEQWNGSEVAVLDKKDLVLGVGGETITADMRMMWDSQNFYVLAHMHDPTPMKNPNTGFDVWGGDALEMFFGPYNLDQGGGLQVKDRQLILSGGGLVGGKFQYYWYNSSEQPQLNMFVKPDDDGKGYKIEASIPWSALNVPDPSDGRLMRFDIGFDDSEGSGRVRQWLWNGEDGNAQNRDKWGKALLKAAAVPDTEAPVIAKPEKLTYMLTDAIDLTVTAQDALSGVASVTLQLDGKPVANPLKSEPLALPLGTHTLSVTATDNAGNQAETSYPLNVVIDLDHLDDLLNTGAAKGHIKDKIVLKLLNAQVALAQKNKNDAKKVRLILTALEMQVKALAGKKIDAAFAEVLIQAIQFVKASAVPKD